MADSNHATGGRGLPRVVIFPPEIDISNARRLGEQLHAALEPGAGAVVADLTATTFCDSSGIKMLALAHAEAAANRTELRLVVPSAAVLRVLALMGIDFLIPIYPSLGTALTAGPSPRA